MHDSPAISGARSWKIVECVESRKPRRDSRGGSGALPGQTGAKAPGLSGRLKNPGRRFGRPGLEMAGKAALPRFGKAAHCSACAGQSGGCSGRSVFRRAQRGRLPRMGRRSRPRGGMPSKKRRLILPLRRRDSARPFDNGFQRRPDGVPLRRLSLRRPPGLPDSG